MEENDQKPKGRGPGRPSLPEEKKKRYKQPGLSLRQDQIDNLEKIATALNIQSRSGVNYGEPSWRTLIAVLADKAPQIIAAIEGSELPAEVEVTDRFVILIK